MAAKTHPAGVSARTKRDMVNGWDSLYDSCACRLDPSSSRVPIEGGVVREDSGRSRPKFWFLEIFQSKLKSPPKIFGLALVLMLASGMGRRASALQKIRIHFWLTDHSRGKLCHCNYASARRPCRSSSEDT